MTSRSKFAALARLAKLAAVGLCVVHTITVACIIAYDLAIMELAHRENEKRIAT